MTLGGAAASAEELEFRSVMGSFASGVTVVTVGNGDVLHGMTANAVMSVSLRPPLVAIALDERSLTERLVREAGHFTINILSEEQRDLALRFATPMARYPDLFGDATPSLSMTGDPLVEANLAYLACQVVSSYLEGDHSLHVASVSECWRSPSYAPPLVFHRGRFSSTSCHNCVVRRDPMMALEIFYDEPAIDLWRVS